MWVAGCFELIEESQQRLLKTLALIDWCTSSNCVGVGRSKWRRIGKSRLCVRKKLSFWSLLSDPLFRVGSWKGLVCQLASTFFRRVKNPVFVDSHSMLSTRRYLEILVANILGNSFPPKISCTANTYFCYSHTVYTPVHCSVNESFGQFRTQAFIVLLHLNTCAVTLNLARTLPLKEVQLDVVQSGDDGDNKNYT